MPFDRRSFLRQAALLPVAASGLVGRSAAALEEPPADHVLRIARSLIELAPDRYVSTLCYNGSFPAPLLRLREGEPVVIDVHNDTDQPEQVHWHGQRLPVEVDGSAEEGTPWIPARGMRRLVFSPGPPGLRFYHSHVVAGSDLARGQYSGLVGPVWIEPRSHAGSYDREVFLTLKEFEPFLSRVGDMDMDFLLPDHREPGLRAAGLAAKQAMLTANQQPGFEVGYQSFTINGRKLGHGEPIRVRAGERVLFHVLNGSATEIRSLALPGHSFRVVALDGNPVAQPAEVPVLWLGTAERVSAVVAMRNPGVWVLGELNDDDRQQGMGIVVEYAGRHGEPRWRRPASANWDYRRFGAGSGTVVEPDEVIELNVEKRNAALDGFNQWTINGAAFDMEAMTPRFPVRLGRRYRLRVRNHTDDIHPIHLHRHAFQLTRIAGQPVHGITKDVVMLGGYQSLELDFTADQPGLSLFHCHMQLHMDFGFMALFDCS